jgi:trehalose utilization protein
MIKALVWNEFLHEKSNAKIAKIYPKGIHGCVAQALNTDKGIKAGTAWLEQPEHGLTREVLDKTDVLLWWGHMAHDRVRDEIVDRVHTRVLEGMGLIVLHSGHYSKIFKKLMGTTCSLCWREAGEKARLWVTQPGHPIAQGIDRYVELPHEEMYGEPFGIPVPDEQVFVSWFQGGEVFRSGCCFFRGNGKIFYFQPGHETYPIYHNKKIQMILKNAVKWAAPTTSRWIDSCPRVKPEMTREKIKGYR